jgi:hypothetical protein
MLLETFLPGRNVALWLQKFSPFSGERGEEVKDLDYQAAGGPVKPSGPRRYLSPTFEAGKALQLPRGTYL